MQRCNSQRIGKYKHIERTTFGISILYALFSQHSVCGLCPLDLLSNLHFKLSKMPIEKSCISNQQIIEICKDAKGISYRNDYSTVLKSNAGQFGYKGSSKYLYHDGELKEIKSIQKMCATKQKLLREKYLTITSCSPTTLAGGGCKGSLLSNFHPTPFYNIDENFQGTCHVQRHCRRIEKNPYACQNCKDYLPHIPAQPRQKRKYKLNKRKVTDKIHAIFNTKAARKFCAFYSISFPFALPDELCHKVLNIWLTRLRKTYKIPLYLWVSERQKTGTLHFHLITTTYMNIRIVNHFMKSELKTLKKHGEPCLQSCDLDKYNGVDVEKITSKSRALSKYMSKYVSKSDETFNHLVWHCSRTVSELFTHATYGRVEQYLKYLQNIDAKVSIFENEYIINIYFDNNFNNSIINTVKELNEILLSSK